MCSYPHNSHTVKERRKKLTHKKAHKPDVARKYLLQMQWNFFNALKYSSIVSHCFMIKKCFILYGKLTIEWA
jgi:hypothetical protein